MQGVFNDGILNRTGTLSRTELNGTKVTGTWEGGLLRGEVTETLVNTGWVEGYYKVELQTKVTRRFAKISQARRTPLLGRFQPGDCP